MKRTGFSYWVPQAMLAVTVVALMLAGTSRLYAQVDTGSISGTVEDQSGGVIPGAKVILTNEGTNASLTVTTGPDGSYTISPVRIGSYTLSASFEGFQTTTQKNVTVNVAAHVVIDFKLSPGQVTQTVEVTAGAPLLVTQNAAVGQVVGQRSVNNLPLNGRNFTFLAQLVAGVNSPQADTRGNASTGAFAANGLRPAQNNYLLDGIDNNSDTVDFLNGTNFVVLPPVDAIQEFKVQTTNFSAEHGRSGAAVLNATIKSGTNSIHGAVWEFLRNDVMDAADFFVNAGGQKKGKYRLNQFGGAIGGPIVKDRVFFFGDFEALRRRQGAIHTGSVPTAAERASGFTDFSDLLTQGGSRPDLLGRSIPFGAVLDPATTRPVTGGVVDPTTGLTATGDGFVRDPFAGNIIPATRPDGSPTLDANAINLLNLYPAPTNSSLFQNFTTSPVLIENRKAFDIRVDANIDDKNQFFGRFSYVDDPQLIPGIFGGVADGGGFQEGTQTALSKQGLLSWTHTFSPTVVNVARAGISYIHTSRFSPSANDLSGLPKQFGVQDIPQDTLNGGLPAFGINGLQTLGSNAFLPSDEVSSTIQISDDFTKIYGKHTFKMGIEFQHVKFSTLQPPWSRGQFNYDGAYTDIPNVGGGNTGRAEFVLNPIAATVPNGVDFVGGPSAVFVSNISLTDNGKNYWGTYINDDWKVSSKLTLNLGLRWDFFGLTGENHSNQANFVPGGPPSGSPQYLMPKGKNAPVLSDSFINLLAKDGIGLQITNAYGDGLGTSQKYNFAPRVGFAYQFTPKLVARAGFGIFYNGFENRGFSPNLGESYPFQFNFAFFRPGDNSPIVYPGCTSAFVGPIGNATLETGFSCTPLSAALVNANGLALRGIQFDYITPYSMGGNFTVQYQMTPSLSVQAGYVTTMARHLEAFPNMNNVTSIQPASANAQDFVPFKDFARGSSYATTNGNSYYHGLQVTVEKQYASGLNLLGTYTYSKARSDAGDLLNGGALQNYRAPDVPNFGIQGDYGLANFDIRNVFHFSGGYELPFGHGKRFMANVGGVTDKVFGGWSIIWSTTLQGGQPMTIPCANDTATGTGCYALVTGDPYSGPHDVNQFLNPAAFNQPCTLGSNPPTPTGCVAATGLEVLGGPAALITGPGFGRLDFSVFKDIQLNERFRLQFRSEFFNIANHPNFNAPGFGGNGVLATFGATNFLQSTFGRIASTRDAPNDPRQIQFALKLYF